MSDNLFRIVHADLVVRFCIPQPTVEGDEQANQTLRLLTVNGVTAALEKLGGHDVSVMWEGD